MKQRVDLVRFKDGALLLGRELDPHFAVADGQSVSGRRVEMYFHDSTFLRLEFTAKATVQRVEDESYHQLIPWVNVATVIYRPIEVAPIKEEKEPEKTRGNSKSSLFSR